MKSLIVACVFLGLVCLAYGQTPPAKNEQKFEDTGKWFEDVEKRKEGMDTFSNTAETDDPTTISRKNAARAHLTVVANYINSYKTKAVARNDLWSVGIMRTIEANMSAAGRYLYGAQWSEKPCGVGLLLSKCGAKSDGK